MGTQKNRLNETKHMFFFVYGLENKHHFNNSYLFFFTGPMHVDPIMTLYENI